MFLHLFLLVEYTPLCMSQIIVFVCVCVCVCVCACQSLALICEGYFQDRVTQTICRDWLPTLILLSS
jgi:hypothetical protein